MKYKIIRVGIRVSSEAAAGFQFKFSPNVWISCAAGVQNTTGGSFLIIDLLLLSARIDERARARAPLKIGIIKPPNQLKSRNKKKHLRVYSNGGAAA